MPCHTHTTKHLPLCWLLLLVPLPSAAQTLPHIAPPTTNPPAVWHADTLLHNAWAGGLNNPQLSAAADLDNNSTPELLLLDRCNNATLVFSHSNGSHYIAQPQLAAQFPPLHDWALLADFNADQLPDLLTYGTAAIQYYTAQQQPNGEIQYVLSTNALRYDNNGTPTPVPANPVDLPAFADINHDGDVDILQFDFSGSYVEWYENQSMETTATPANNVFFILADACWGKFSEAAFNNQINTNDDCIDGSDHPAPPPPSDNANTIYPLQKKIPNPNNNGMLRHSGSSLLAAELDGNLSTTDLIVGDVAGRNLQYLSNVGTPTNALMELADTHYPSGNESVDMYIFPQPFLLDADNDQLADLVVATNEVRSQTDQHLWWYKNTHTQQQPVWELQNKRFLVEDMLDVGVRSYPAFADYNHDGLLDLWVGNRGYLDTTTNQYRAASVWLYRNVGSVQQPQFVLQSTNYQQLSATQLAGMYPAFGDLDGDGDTDLLTGDELGNLHYFANTAQQANDDMQLELQQANLITTNGDAAVPCLFDLNGDQLPDLIVGETAGKLSYYRNTSVGGVVSFVLENNFWGAVDVRSLGSPFGYSAPQIAVWRGDTLLLVASESGRVWAYGQLHNAVFTLLSDSLTNARQGGRGGLAWLPSDTSLAHLVTGNYRGGLVWYDALPNTANYTPNLAATTASGTELRAWVQGNRLYVQHLGTHWDTTIGCYLYDTAGRCVWQQSIAATRSSSDVFSTELPTYLPQNAGYIGSISQPNTPPIGFRWWHGNY